MRPSATLDNFESPSMRETPSERYVFGAWFTPAPAPATAVPVSDAGQSEDRELSLSTRLALCVTAGGITALVIMIIVHVALGR